MELLVASAGNSGSTALQAALETMGIRAYGPEEFVFYAPGLRHAELGGEPWGGAAGLLGSCGVQAVVADLDTMPIVQELIARNPKAKLLVLRRDWARWRASKRNTIARGRSSQIAVRAFAMLFLCHWLPLGLVWPVAQGDIGASFYRQGGGVTMELLDYCHLFARARQAAFADPNRTARLTGKLKSFLASEEEYQGFLDQFRHQVPQDRLLEAEIGQLGWHELHEFLGRAGQVEVEGPLPKAKLKGFGKIIARMYMFPAKHLALLALLLASAALNWLAFSAARRAFAVARTAGAGSRGAAGAARKDE